MPVDPSRMTRVVAPPLPLPELPARGPPDIWYFIRFSFLNRAVPPVFHFALVSPVPQCLILFLLSLPFSALSCTFPHKQVIALQCVT